jgi:LemA protein
MGKRILLLLVVVLVLVGFASCGAYNSLVTAEESVDAAWAQVENVYQRRADLIPNLVETVKGAADFEQETLTGVIEARAKASQVTAELTPEAINDPATLERFQQVQGELSSALSRLLVTVERYPELKANQNFLALQSQLEGTENRIAVERRNFNDVARDFNTRIRRLPGSLIAGVAGMRQKAYFEATEGAETPPAVNFD